MISNLKEQFSFKTRSNEIQNFNDQNFLLLGHLLMIWHLNFGIRSLQRVLRYGQIQFAKVSSLWEFILWKRDEMYFRMSPFEKLQSPLLPSLWIQLQGTVRHRWFFYILLEKKGSTSLEMTRLRFSPFWEVFKFLIQLFPAFINGDL